MTELKPIAQAQYANTDRDIVCQVLLNNIEVMADIGALAIELGVLQPLLIHVALTVVPPTMDDLTHTFDYSNIRKFAKELADQRIVLIETFAQRLAQRCLAFEMVLDAEVRIDKPKAVPGCLAGTRVIMSKA
jgi:7,8-dihydroneopterin aldolase/epimerase/oxygenase